MIDFRHLLRSRGRRGGNREQPAPAIVTPPASNLEVRHPIQLLPEQRHTHLVKVKYCEDTRPKDQLEASKQQHCNFYCNLSRASAQATFHTILLGVGRVIHAPHTLEPLEDLGLDTHTTTRLDLKLHAHSVQYAYKLSSTRRVLEKALVTKIRHGLLLETLLVLINLLILLKGNTVPRPYVFLKCWYNTRHGLCNPQGSMQPICQDVLMHKGKSCKQTRA
eukprot:912245-Pelagomonas_calceolata.AAC.1